MGYLVQHIDLWEGCGLMAAGCFGSNGVRRLAMTKFIGAALGLCLLVVAVIGGGIAYSSYERYLQYEPSAYALVPYDAVASEFRSGDMCIMQRGGMLKVIDRYDETLRVAYLNPGFTDLYYEGDLERYPLEHRATGSMGFHVCRDGETLLMAWYAYEAATCEYLFTRGADTRGFCGESPWRMYK